MLIIYLKFGMLESKANSQRQNEVHEFVMINSFINKSYKNKSLYIPH